MTVFRALKVRKRESGDLCLISLADCSDSLRLHLSVYCQGAYVFSGGTVLAATVDGDLTNNNANQRTQDVYPPVFMEAS